LHAHWRLALAQHDCATPPRSDSVHPFPTSAAHPQELEPRANFLQKRNRSTKYFAVFATYRRRGRFERRLVVGSAISARDIIPTIRLERFVQTLYNSKVSESVEELLELC
jgi:hypothetical protein